MFDRFKAKRLNRAIESKDEKDELCRLAFRIDKKFKVDVDPEKSWEDMRRQIPELPESNLSRRFVMLTEMFTPRGIGKKAIALMVSLTMVFSGVGVAAGMSEPGDFLYPYKMMMEKAKVYLAMGDYDKAQELLSQCEDRLEGAKAIEDEKLVEDIIDIIKDNLKDIERFKEGLTEEELGKFKPALEQFKQEFENFLEKAKEKADNKDAEKEENESREEEEKARDDEGSSSGSQDNGNVTDPNNGETGYQPVPSDERNTNVEHRPDEEKPDEEEGDEDDEDEEKGAEEKVDKDYKEFLERDVLVLK